MTLLRPARAVKPGQILDRELKARGWTQKDLAEIMGRPVQVINEIVAGVKQVTPKTALELAQVFGTSAEFWMNLETNYRLHLATSISDDSIARKSRLYSIAPVKEMLKRLWIPVGESISELETAVCAFLEIANPIEQPSIAANRRHSVGADVASISQIATIKRGKHLAQAQKLRGPFKRDQFLRDLPSLFALSRKADQLRDIPDWFLNRGIHFVIVPHLPQSFLDGAFFNIESGPVILLTLRYDRIDSFWFTLSHEVGHLASKHEGVFLDNIDEKKSGSAEEEANAFATDRLIDPTAFRSFVAKMRPFFSRAAVTQFADKIERHPGIVLGRLQHDGLVPYMNLRVLLEKVSPELDDWIDRPNPGKTLVTSGI